MKIEIDGNTIRCGREKQKRRMKKTWRPNYKCECGRVFNFPYDEYYEEYYEESDHSKQYCICGREIDKKKIVQTM